MTTEQFYIDGRWVAPSSPDTLDIVSPANGAVIGRVAKGTRTDVDHAVAAAHRAFETWGRTTPDARRAVLVRLVEAYERRRDDISDAMTAEMGAPRGLARGAQSGAGLGHLRDFVKAIDAVRWEEAFDDPSADMRVVLEPVGVAALITPWNWPMNQIALKVGAALAAGCTMVLKPSELAPLSAALFAEVVHEAGVPAGVFNLIHGTGPEVGEVLASHPDVASVSLTGSTRAGIAVSRAGAESVKRIGLELGGKGANLIFADADVHEAVTTSARAMFRNSGQSCNAPSRMLVERSVYGAAVAAAVEAAQAVVVGDPLHDATHMGPVVSRSQFDRIQALIARGVAEGARLVAGGPGHPDGLDAGFYVKPTVFADATNDMAIAREEIFGPVFTITAFDTEDEAVRIANETVYGLANYVWTTDTARMRRLSRTLRSGMVRFNGSDLPYGSPFGGFGQSGIGREGGVWGIEEFLEVKAISGLPRNAA